MHALSVHLTSKRLYIADLAGRLEAMEKGKAAMDAVAYRLYARRMKAAISAYPADLLTAQLGRSHPAVVQAIEHQQFELEGMLSGRGSGRALITAQNLLRSVRSRDR